MSFYEHGIMVSNKQYDTHVRKMRCAHCDRIMSNYAGGYSRGYKGEPLCHPNVSGRPDCYKLVTVFGHKIPCVSKVCYEDHDDQKTYIGNLRKKVPFGKNKG